MALLAVLVAAASAWGRQPPLPRATADRPDSVSGPQVHVVYALPSDGVDRSLDVDGTLTRSVTAWERWLAGPDRRADAASRPSGPGSGHHLRTAVADGRADRSVRCLRPRRGRGRTGCHRPLSARKDLRGLLRRLEHLLLWRRSLAACAPGGGGCAVPARNAARRPAVRFQRLCPETRRVPAISSSRCCTSWCIRSASSRPARRTTRSPATPRPDERPDVRRFLALEPPADTRPRTRRLLRAQQHGLQRSRRQPVPDPALAGTAVRRGTDHRSGSRVALHVD